MQVVFVNNHASIIFLVKRNTKASLDVYVLAIKGAKHGPYDGLLVCGSSQEVVEDVWHDDGLNQALQLLHLEAEVEVW